MSLKSPADHYLYIRLKASMFGVVGSFVLFAAYLAIPPIGIFSGVLAPFPAAHNRLIHGRLSSIIVILGTTAAITVVFGVFAGWLYLCVCGMISFLMPELLLRGINGSRVLFWTTLVNLLTLAAGYFAYGNFTGVNLQMLITNEITASLKQAISLYEKGGVSGDDLELLKRSMATVADLLQRLYPALAATTLFVIAGCNLVLLKKSTAGTSLNLPIGSFSGFRNPDLLIWGLIAAGFSLLLPESAMTTPTLNLLLVFIVLYFFQGMAIVSALIAKYSVPALVRVLLYAMLIAQPYLLALVAGIGLFDLWVDFRTQKTQENL